MKMEERDRLIQEKGEAIGLLKGKIEAIQSFIEANRKENISDQEIHTMIQKFFQLTSEEADALLRSE